MIPHLYRALTFAGNTLGEPTSCYDPWPMTPEFDPKAWLSQLSVEMRDGFARNRRVMSFGEYIGLLHKDMARQARSAAHYLRDVFDHFGTSQGARAARRGHALQPLRLPLGRGKDALRGQEEVQGAIYRLVSNFAREGRTNRLTLLHGPNGSAKSTVVACIERAMEHYSHLDEGALYRFNWVFPVQNVSKGGIGFGGGRDSVADAETYAYLDEDLIEAKISDELRDHPLLLLPRDKRRELITTHLASEIAAGFRPARTLVDGDLSHRNRQIFEALLAAYHGDLGRVLRHVQVERFLHLPPLPAVRGHGRAATCGRRAHPPAFHGSIAFVAAGGPANRVPVRDAGRAGGRQPGHAGFRGSAQAAVRIVEVPARRGRERHHVSRFRHAGSGHGLLATSNESFLAAFKEVPEFQSFKGRMELVRAPYLLDVRIEKQIYDEHVERGLALPAAGGILPRT
jgi:serine protein kinase